MTLDGRAELMNSVVIYGPRMLPWSQTFVADQARALSRWEPTLVGRQAAANGASLSDLRVVTRQPGPRAVVERATRRVPVLRDTVERIRPDLVHAHFLTGGVDAVHTLGTRAYPIVVTAHGFDATWHGNPTATNRPSQWLHGVLRYELVRRSAYFIAVSRFIRDCLIAVGAREDSVHVHYTGIDTDYFQGGAPLSNRSGVLFVGRLVEKKGARDLLEALAILKSRDVVVKTRIIGDGPDRGRLETFARRERLQVRFTGATDRRGVRAAMREARLFCVPSRTASSGDREGFGMVFAEAQAMGVPVVATRSGGIPEAVADGRTGVLVDEADPPGLARALEACSTDSHLLDRLAAASRPYVVEHFDLRKQTRRLEELYEAFKNDHDRRTVHRNA